MRLRIVVWNCNMRLHDKTGRLRGLCPDLAVIPECACPEVLFRRSLELNPADFAWEGTNPRKGLMVLAFGPWRFRTDRSHQPRSGTTLPLHVSGPAAFRLLTVWGLPRWAHRYRDPPPEPLGKAVERLVPFLSTSPAIVAGDFNRTLARRRRDGRRASSVLARHLEALGFVSAYHHDRGVSHGEEPEPTFCRYRRLPDRHHADHVFVDRATAGRLRGVEIGHAPRWISSSDHMPLIVELDVARGWSRATDARRCRRPTET
jgi:hypothetical protein